MASQENSSNSKGLMPPNSTISITPSISPKSGGDGEITIQGQKSGSTSNHTGKASNNPTLTNLAAFTLDPKDPKRIHNPVPTTESPPIVVPAPSPVPGRILQKTAEKNFVDPFQKFKPSTQRSGKRNRGGAIRTQRLTMDYNVKDQYAPKNRASGQRNVSRQNPPPGWVDYDEVIREADEAIARAAKNSTSTTAMPAITETFKQVTGSEDRTRIATHKTDIPMLSTDAPAHPIHVPTEGMDTIADMLQFWRNTFGDRRVCLTSDPKGPHLTYTQLSCFSMTQVDDCDSESVGYLTCDILDNAGSALLGPDTHLIGSAVLKPWIDAMAEGDTSFLPAVEPDCNFVVIFINSHNVHWHVVVIDVGRKLWYIRDSSRAEARKLLTIELIKPFISGYWQEDFTLVDGLGPHQDDGINCGVFALDNALQIVHGTTETNYPGSQRRVMLLQAIIEKARAHADMQWQPNPAARIFPQKGLADMPKSPDVDLSMERDSSRFQYRSKSVGQISDTVRSPSPPFNFVDDSVYDQDFELLDELMEDDPLEEVEDELTRLDVETESFEPIDESRDQSQLGGVKVSNSTAMDIDEEASTSNLAVVATTSDNICLEAPEPWRLLPQNNNARTRWAEKQVLQRIPAYFRLHKVKGEDRSNFFTPADIAGHYSVTQPPETRDSMPQIMLLQHQTFVVARDLNSMLSASITVLNMASEKRPGGMLFMNSLQQEESLCMQSDLYHRLLLLKGRYPLQPGQLIYSGDVFVCFSNLHHALPLSEAFATNVISMAAPVCHRDTPAEKYLKGTQAVQMRKNIKTLMDAADVMSTEVLVLGAWGCGVYHHPPAEVARMFRDELSKRDWSRSCISHVVFAIADREKGQPVWTPFMEVFEESLPGLEPAFIDYEGDLPIKSWLEGESRRK